MNALLSGADLTNQTRLLDNASSFLTTSSPTREYKDGVDENEDLAAGVIALFVCIVGGGGNGFVVFVYFNSRRLRNSTFIFILNLAITDLISSLASGTYAVNYFTDGALTRLSFYGCMAVEQIVTLLIFVSQSVIAVTTLERYIAICHREKYEKVMTKRKIKFMIGVSWVFPLPLVLVPNFGFNRWDSIQECIYEKLYHDWIYWSYSAYVLFLMFIVVVLYSKILMKAREFYKNFRPAQITGVNASAKRIRDRRRSIRNGKIMGIVTLCFIVCWLPYHICQFGFGSNLSIQIYDVSLLTCTLGLMNCIVNPFIYAWQKRTFRAESRRIFGCSKGLERKQSFTVM